MWLKKQTKGSREPTDKYKTFGPSPPLSYAFCSTDPPPPPSQSAVANLPPFPPSTLSPWVRQVTITYCGLNVHQPSPLLGILLYWPPPPPSAVANFPPAPPLPLSPWVRQVTITYCGLNVHQPSPLLGILLYWPPNTLCPTPRPPLPPMPSPLKREVTIS